MGYTAVSMVDRSEVFRPADTAYTLVLETIQKEFDVAQFLWLSGDVTGARQQLVYLADLREATATRALPPWIQDAVDDLARKLDAPPTQVV